MYGNVKKRIHAAKKLLFVVHSLLLTLKSCLILSRTIGFQWCSLV